MADSFRVGDMVYASDWCYGEIVAVDLANGVALVEFETCGGGGSYSFELSELRRVQND